MAKKKNKRTTQKRALEMLDLFRRFQADARLQEIIQNMIGSRGVSAADKVYLVENGLKSGKDVKLLVMFARKLTPMQHKQAIWRVAKLAGVEFHFPAKKRSASETRNRLNNKNKAAGYSNAYLSYLASPEWQEMRQRYRDSDRPQSCLGCRKPYAAGFQLHHKSYARLGCEDLTDLLWACPDCHRRLHEMQKAQKLTVEQATNAFMASSIPSPAANVSARG